MANTTFLARTALLALALAWVGLGDARADTERAVVHHVPPAEAARGEPLRLAAVIEDAWREDGLVAFYRPLGADTPFARAPFELSSAGGYYATIPGYAVGRPGLEYYIVGVTRDGETIEHFASARWPHAVRVEATPRERWVEAERRRLAGRTSRVRASARYIDFGDSGGDGDHMSELEVDWTYRLVGALYHIQLGFGGVDGRTPMSATADASVDQGARYGYGGVRLRLHPRIAVDAAAMLGWGRDGFVAGGRGALVLGRDWGTSVQVRGAYLEELGSELGLRLQWDTVQPLLMGLEVAITDWPGAAVESGSYLAYDLAYPISSQLRVGGQLTYGSRGNRPGGLGVGLGTSFEF